jgi:hypothetical protein
MAGFREEMKGLLEQATCLTHTLKGLSTLTSRLTQHPDTAGPRNEDRSSKIRNQIQAGIDRRDDEFLRHFFQSKTTSVLSDEQLASALKELGVHLNEEEIKVLHNDAVMDLEGFQKTVRFPSPIEQLLNAFQLSHIFSDAMSAVLYEEGINRPGLRQASQLTPAQIEEMCLAAMPFVIKIIQDEVTKLKASFEVMDTAEVDRGATKFEVLPDMRAGSDQDFHGGLSDRVACLSAGATVEVSVPLESGAFSCLAARKDSEAGGGRRGRSMYRAGLECAVRDIAQEAAASSEAWRDKTNGGTRVTSHNLRSVFMNQIDPGKDTTPVFPGKAPFHPHDRYLSLLIAYTL